MKAIIKLYQKLQYDLFSLQFLKFVVAGVISTVCAMVSRIIFQIEFTYSISVSLSTLLGAVVSFLLSKYHVYDVHDEHIAAQSIKFVIISIISVVLVTSVASFFLRLFKFIDIGLVSISAMEAIAQIIALGVNMIYSFFIKKYFVFRKIYLKKYMQ